MGKIPKSGRAPSLKDIAAAAGVSFMTVSNVMRPKDPNGRALFTEETAKRVRQAALKLGYVPNRAARAMRTRETGVVGFVSANFSEERGTVENFGVHPFLVGLNHIMAPTGRHVSMVELNELELKKSADLPAPLREKFFDALVIHYGLSPRAIRLIEEFNVPLIYWDSGVFQKDNCVFREEFEVGRAATRRLLELGHREIAFAGGRGNWQNYKAGLFVHYSFKGRYEGYLDIIKENKLKPHVLEDYAPDGWAQQMEKEGITAVVVQTSYVTLLRAAQILGKRVPEDISVLACDLEASVADRGDLPGGVLYNRYEAGRIVGELLLKRMGPGRLSVSSVRLPIEVRDGSTAAPVNLRGRARREAGV